MTTLSARRGLLLLLIALGGLASSLPAQNLRVATLNFWSAVDYCGTLSVGSFESPEQHALRLRALTRLLQDLQPDVVALQESNDVFRVAAELEETLGYDALVQRVNAGIKIGPCGIPCNLNEGLILLARKELELQPVAVWDLSRRFGAVGNTVSFHFDDQNYALVGRVRLDTIDVYIVNVHLSSGVPAAAETHEQLDSILAVHGISLEKARSLHADLNAGSLLRHEEATRLLAHIERELTDGAVVLMGDFNAAPDAPEIQAVGTAGFTDAFTCAGTGAGNTWDPSRNVLIRYSTDAVTADGAPLDPFGLLAAWYDRQPRRIDYVFLGPHGTPGDVLSASLIGDFSTDSTPVSDHFGITAEIDLSRISRRLNALDRYTLHPPQRSLELLPILMYDTDVGFGYGGKLFLLNYLDWSESFDFTIFNSTKGERWYRLVFSLPDFEVRQGRIYPFAFDFIIDYDRYLKNNFFGIGGNSHSEDRETYTKEPLDVFALVSRAFSPRFVGQIGVKYRTVNNFGYRSGGLFTSLPPQNLGRSSGLSLLASVRYDSRDSYVNPSRGFVLQLDLEAGPRMTLSSGNQSRPVTDYSLFGGLISCQSYHTLFYPKTVFAARVQARMVNGSRLPVHSYVSLGGGGTLRGYPQDRFIDKAGVLANVELRFPLFWRIGGVALWDIGKLTGSASAPGSLASGWKSNVGGGLRLSMDTFVVRADIGFSRESTGFYFNFGHAF